MATIYKAQKVMTDQIPVDEKVDLFSMLQKIVAILQLSFIMDYQLPDGWFLVSMLSTVCLDLQSLCLLRILLLRTVEKYLNVTNGVFGVLYASQRPSETDCQELEVLLDDMMQKAGPDGLLKHMEKEGEEAPCREEIRHNLTAGLLLGQQSLANALFWLVLHFAEHPDMLERVRKDEDQLAAMILEIFRTHPPSSPFLMPYLALEDDEYNDESIKKGDLIVIIPIMLLALPMPRK